MNSSTPTINDAGATRGRAALLVCMALAVPWSAITGLGVLQFGTWPAVAVPFGMTRILIVHLLASLPMAMWIAWRVHRVSATRGNVVLVRRALRGRRLEVAGC